MHFENSSIANESTKIEMLAFVPLCTHENGDECLIIGNIELPISAQKLTKNISLSKTLDTNSGYESEKFDVIMFDGYPTNLQEAFRVLKKDGILCAKLPDNFKDGIKQLGDYYRIVMPYHNMKMVFASNKYHPTADIILDKSDFLEGNEYYNSDIHLATFAIYESAKKELRGVIKN